MTRFARQRDKHSCGQLAVINAAKWCGLDLTLEDVKRLRRRNKIKKGHGTWHHIIDKDLRRELSGIATVQRAGWVTRRSIAKALSKPNTAIVISYLWHHREDATKRAQAHSEFVFDYKEGSFSVVNAFVGSTCDRLTLDYFARNFLDRWGGRSRRYPRMWIIRKKD